MVASMSCVATFVGQRRAFRGLSPEKLIKTEGLYGLSHHN